MITVNHLTKQFGSVTALADVSCTVPDHCIYGLVGTNGAGKSTLLRILSGVYEATEGQVTLNDEPIFDNPNAKANIIFVADDLYLPPARNLDFLEQTYASAHPGFDHDKFHKLIATFGLDPKKRTGSFSKGMKRIAAACLALACPGQVYLFDETFDGMDPVVRTGMKKIIAEELSDRGISVLVTSHSLRELEGFADVLAMIHGGTLVLEQDTDTLKTSMMKIHTAFHGDVTEETLRTLGVNAERFTRTGSTVTFFTTGDPDEVRGKLSTLAPLFLDVFPLTLEEVFTMKAAALGYDFAWKEDESHA